MVKRAVAQRRAQRELVTIAAVAGSAFVDVSSHGWDLGWLQLAVDVSINFQSSSTTQCRPPRSYVFSSFQQSRFLQTGEFLPDPPLIPARSPFYSRLSLELTLRIAALRLRSSSLNPLHTTIRGLSMSESKTVPTILDVVKSITANRETGRLEINTSGTHGTLLFHEGKLVDARLGSLSGFQAVNAAVALRDAEVNFDYVVPASHVSTISPNERVVLSRFFAIEAADMEQPTETHEPEIDWNPAPEPVVPLTQAETIPFALFSSRLTLAVCLALLLGVAVGAVALRSRVKLLRQSSAVASAVESQPSSVANAQPEIPKVQTTTPNVQPETVTQPAVAKAQQETPEVQAESKKAEPKVEQVAVAKDVKQVPEAPAEVSQRAVASEPSSESRDGDANVQDLTGEWRIINTVEKTAYKSFGNMEVGFRLTINQNGKEFTAKGEKFLENGQTLPTARRTPIQLKGLIEGDKVIATFIEDGRSRRTNGRFIWKLQRSGDGLSGTFVSTAANSSGRSAVTRRQ